MKRPAKANHKPHMSRITHSPNADGARTEAHADDNADDAVVACVWWSACVSESPGRCLSQASERVFAAVRPGFVAPCMVEAAGRAGGPFGDPRGLVAPAWSAVPTCLPLAINPSRTTRRGPSPRGLLAGDPDGKRRASRNRQREYLAESRGVVWRGDWRTAAITARESSDAQDLRLTTLSSRMYVRSNSFKFVVT